MVNLLRKYQQSLMIVITILVIIAFVWFWNGTQAGSIGRPGSDVIGTIYGRRVTETEIGREVRKFEVARRLGLIELLQSLAGYDPSQIIENFAWNLMVLHREAEQLQIYPDDEAVRAALSNLRALQTNGQFDPMKLNDLVQGTLAPRGFSDTVIDELLRDDLRLRKIKEIIGSTVELSEAEFRAMYAQEHEKMELSVIRFNTEDLAPTVQISEEDVRKAFEQRKTQFLSDEKRKVKYVTFALTDAEKAFTGRERTAAMQKIADRANEFTQAMLEENAKFDEVAKKFEVPVATTGEFTRSAPDPVLAKLPTVSATAWQLTPQEPDSDVIQSENAFHVLHLETVTPSRPLTLEEAKPRLVETLREERAEEMVSARAAEARKMIEAELKAGKSFAEAAAAAGQKPVAIPPFSIAEPSKADVPDQDAILQTAVELGEKQISEFVPAGDGGLLVYLDKRQPIDTAAFEKDKAKLFPLFLRQKQEGAFREWLRVRREAAKITIAQS